jgi:hypothetical protein
MTRVNASAVSICWALLPVALSCSRNTRSDQVEPGASPTVASEAKTTAVAIRQFYPIDCAANAAWWKWATCHDETKGFDQVLACATAARDEVKAARARLPAQPPPTDASCSAAVELKSRTLVESMTAYLGDLVPWLAAHRAKLAGPLRTSSVFHLDDEKLTEGMPQETDEKYRGDAPMLGFGMVNDIACTNTIYRCGLLNSPDSCQGLVLTASPNCCGMRQTALRLGVECGTSSPYHRSDGKPYNIASISDLNDPTTWLYDRSTQERIP